MKILVCNVGSTSLKFKLYDMPGEKVSAQAYVERVGSRDDGIYTYTNLAEKKTFRQTQVAVPTYTEGIQLFLTDLISEEKGCLTGIGEIEAVGFKTVLSRGHYGVHRLTEEVLQGMEDYMAVAPAHNGPYLEAIHVFQKLLPQAALIGSFETAFHQTIPLAESLYAIPYEWYEKYGIRRMGYHGASHGHVAAMLLEREGEADQVVSCHLGGSCSLCAIDGGKSLNNSFGFSLQAGVFHNSRVGDMDAYIIPYLLKQGLTIDEITFGLEKNSGLLGISGVSNDLRQVEEAAEAGNERAVLAVDMFVNSIVSHIGAYAAQMGGLKQLVFTGGIGENSASVRRRVCRRLAFLGVKLSDEKNESSGKDKVISAEDSQVKVHVIPANEELGIARNVYRELTHVL
ncbi:MAG: acetate/propionate family kinase [Lachnospiraceae bacterium]|jgi:acetate kinase|nr:acetate/propionate family kinase [Lachnospiraceae bacterium]